MPDNTDWRPTCTWQRVHASERREQLINRRQKTKNGATLCVGMLLGLVTSLSPAFAQVATLREFTSAPVQSNETARLTQSPAPTLTLLEALERAEKNDPQFQSAVSDAKLAHEDRLQSWAALFPPLGCLRSISTHRATDLFPPEDLSQTMVSTSCSNFGVFGGSFWSSLVQLA